MKRILSITFLLGAALGASAAMTPEQIDAKVADLLSRMTLEEKCGQLVQLSGVGLADYMTAAVENGAVGSLLNEVDPETVNALQKIAVEKSRLGIPLVFARDVIHGFKTIFPIPLGQAATWNLDLVEKGAQVAADEASSTGIRWTFSPMVDVSRDARWGRIAESAGEDPYLSAKMGVAMVKGYQGDDLSKPNTMAACVKHFAGYGAAEGGLDYNTTWIPEVQLRDVYLPPFKACSDAGAATFMCSFNDICGVPSSGNKWLLRDVLRGEWGFDGLVVSDWGSIQQMIPHGFSQDIKEAAMQGALAGVDMDMENGAYNKPLIELVQEGKVPMSVIDEMVANVLKLKCRLGLFENPYVDLKTANRFYTPENLQAARDAAVESMVLLKNDGVLPLAPGKKIALIGPMADAQHDQNGTWCFDLDKTHSVTALTALQDRYGKDNVIYAPGLTYSRQRDTKGFDEAIAAAKQADVIIYVGGEEAVLSGEAHCRTDISLPGAQSQLLAALKETGKPVVTVIMTGRPMTIAQDIDNSNAVVYAFHLGTMAGPAVADVLSGDRNFSGHLPVCLPKTVGQMPLYYAHKNTGRPASGIVLIDDIPLEAGQTSTGCTSFYLDAGAGPLYPFGYGLSYTTFDYGTPSLSATEIGKDGEIEVTCRVTNTGKVAGKEVPQLYVRDLVGSLVRPVRELKGFEKIELAPGESKDVKFTLRADDLAYHNLQGERVVEPGDFQLWVSPDAASGEPVDFKLK